MLLQKYFQSILLFKFFKAFSFLKDVDIKKSFLVKQNFKLITMLLLVRKFTSYFSETDLMKLF